MTDPADGRIARLPFSGEEIHGARLLAQAVGFGRELRRAGLLVDLGAAVDFARSLGLVDIGEREQVRAAGAAVFVRRRDDLEPYDEIFARWWRRRARQRSGGPGAPVEDDPELGIEEAAGDTPPESGEERLDTSPREGGRRSPGRRRRTTRTRRSRGSRSRPTRTVAARSSGTGTSIG